MTDKHNTNKQKEANTTQNAVPKLELRHVSKSFGDKEVLKDINLKVMPGESRVILGGSGSGKSVCLKCILGLLTPTSGQILIDGVDTTNLPEKERFKLMTRFGMLFQSGALFDSLTIWENVAFELLQVGTNRKKAKEVALEKLAMVGLQPTVAEQRPSELSGGMQKRVGLARAICMEPEIIFYDEPTTGLDPITADVIDNLILKLKNELGITSIAITHDMKSAFKIADTMAMLYKGEMIEDCSKEEFEASKNPFVKQFVNGEAEGPIESVVKAYKVIA